MSTTLLRIRCRVVTIIGVLNFNSMVDYLNTKNNSEKKLSTSLLSLNDIFFDLAI